MARALVTVIWISLIVGTYVAGNVVGNWLVCLLGLYLLIRYRQRRASRAGLNGQPPVAVQGPQRVSAVTADPRHPRAAQRTVRRWH